MPDQTLPASQTASSNDAKTHQRPVSPDPLPYLSPRFAGAFAFVTFSGAIILGLSQGGTFRGILPRALFAALLGFLVGLVSCYLGWCFWNEHNRRGGQESQNEEGETE